VLAALALVLFGAYDSYPKIPPFQIHNITEFSTIF